MLADPRVKQAMEEWRLIAPGLGFDAESFHHRLVWQKQEPDRSHIVVRLVGETHKLILKKVFKPEAHNMKQSMEMQQKANEHMSGDARFGAPQVLHVSKDGSLSIMEFVPGKTVNDHLEAGKPAVQFLRRTGAWLASFHSSFQTSHRKFQPHFMVNHIQRVSEKVEALEVSVPNSDLFLRCCERIPAIADKFHNAKTTVAQKHGDMNTRNILVGPQGVFGLDFAAESSAPVGYDIVRFLMDYAELFQDPSDVKRGQILAAKTTNGFFKGYDVVGSEDPAVSFLPFVQILNDWRIIPAKSEARSLRQSRRLAVIQVLAEKGFMV
ncbi:Phosphotransferase enzyme family protein [Shimia gijangensis]|uniref:Phosphotransferase enzyme family protein n=1 Tax=Shimia gijangensis TaxID=1470563 RepID=A0A1M6MTH8_9RHOB|nr:phosphotransferase [Shimia gijangensis]SHJ86700.1 Phosphotransferase enzyme family protein [Shimia gijangensis]